MSLPTSDHHTGLPPRRRTALVCVGVFVLCVVVYNSNLRTTASYDSLAASLLPFNFWHGEGFRLDRYANLPWEIGYSVVPSHRGGWVSQYPVVAPILVTPLYFPTVLHPRFHPDDPYYGLAVRIVMEKFAASVITGLSVILVYLTLVHLASARRALLLTVVYAFGTSAWAISSQALWQHGPAQLLCAAALFVLVRNQRPVGGAALLLGLIAGLMTANRPPDIFFSAAVAVIVLRRSGREAWPFFVSAGAVALLLATYNIGHFATLSGGYVTVRHGDGSPLIEPGFPDYRAFLGLLFSNRGLITFCPFLLALLRMPRLARREREEMVVLVLAVLGNLLLYSSYFFWPGGTCYGPRFSIDALPWLIVLLARPMDRIKGFTGRMAFSIAVAHAVLLQAIGAYYYPGGDSGNMAHGVWTVARSSPVLALRSGVQSPMFLVLIAPGLVTREPLDVSDSASITHFEKPPPVRWPGDTTKSVHVAITNRGNRPWSSLGGRFGIGAVRLLARWQRLESPSKNGIEADFWLDLRLRPNETDRETILVTSPVEPGRYLFSVEPAQFDGTRWVPLSARGATPATARLEIVAGPD